MAREKQIEFPPQQTNLRWLPAACLLASLVCIGIVLIVLAVHPHDEFIGPW
jgi:hypothetical protein